MTHHAAKPQPLFGPTDVIMVFAGPNRPKRQDHGSRQARKGQLLRRFKKGAHLS